MVQIGKMNTLRIVGMQAYGMHLDGGKAGDVLLRGKHLAGKYGPGDLLEVFVYTDREQRLLATVQKPYAMVGEFACLRVVASGTAGAFLDWGLESDLFVPKSEQQDNMLQGRFYVVYLFLGETTKRITASTKLKEFLNQQPPQYAEGAAVDLLVYAKTDLGYRTIVNNSHIGMLYANEVFQKLAIGQRLVAYVKKVREDGKIDLRLQQTGYQGIDNISQTILDAIKERGGMVAVSDKSPPEDIYAMFAVSKKNFKKAIGVLYKKRLIVIDSEGVKLA
jgi:uncharacterized protein